MISLNQDGEPCHRGSTSRVEASSPRLRSRGKGQQGGGTVFFCGWWKGWLLVRMTRRRGNGGNGANAIYTWWSSDASDAWISPPLQSMSLSEHFLSGRRRWQLNGSCSVPKGDRNLTISPEPHVITRPHVISLPGAAHSSERIIGSGRSWQLTMRLIINSFIRSFSQLDKRKGRPFALPIFLYCNFLIYIEHPFSFLWEVLYK